jgi:hypothetical protein
MLRATEQHFPEKGQLSEQQKTAPCTKNTQKVKFDYINFATYISLYIHFATYTFHYIHLATYDFATYSFRYIRFATYISLHRFS